MRSSSPTVALLAERHSLREVDRRLRATGVHLLRLPSLENRPVAPSRWIGRLRRAPPPDTVVVSSRAAVEAGLAPWRTLAGPLPRGLEFWAVGPATARALRAFGARRVRVPSRVGGVALAAALGRGRPRRIVYLRSDLAGAELADRLRGRGHTVLDLVVYRTRPPPRPSPRSRARLRRAALYVATSPTGAEELRRLLGREFARRARTVPLVVLGERSRAAARRLGFRRISVAPCPAAQPFTRHLLRELAHVRA
jgi:uroporphyrinogen-III synthase